LRIGKPARAGITGRTVTTSSPCSPRGKPSPGSAATKRRPSQTSAPGNISAERSSAARASSAHLIRTTSSCRPSGRRCMMLYQGTARSGAAESAKQAPVPRTSGDMGHTARFRRRTPEARAESSCRLRSPCYSRRMPVALPNLARGSRSCRRSVSQPAAASRRHRPTSRPGRTYHARSSSLAPARWPVVWRRLLPLRRPM